MKIILINAMWSPLYYDAKKILKDIIETYNIEWISYDYDMDREKILYLNISNMIPLIIIYKDNQELTRLYINENTSQVKEKLVAIINRNND